jgi:hypothetical protein
MENTRIKLLIENGYDEWELVDGMTMNDLLEIGYTEEEAYGILHTKNEVIEESVGGHSEPSSFQKAAEEKPV